MKLRIISDGTARGTKVVTDPGGVMIEGVVAVKWGIGMEDEEAKVQLTVLGMEAEVEKGEMMEGKEEETRGADMEEFVRVEREFCERKVKEVESESSSGDFYKGYWIGRGNGLGSVLEHIRMEKAHTATREEEIRRRDRERLRIKRMKGIETHDRKE